MPSLVFAADQVPVSLAHGSGIRTHRLLTGLARSFSVSLVAYEQPSAQDDIDAAGLRRLLPDVQVTTIPRPQDGQATSAGEESGVSAILAVGRFVMPVYAQALRAVVQQRSSHVVHFDDLGVALSGPVPGTAGVFAPHNVEHRIMQRRRCSCAARRGAAASDPGVRAAFAAVEWRKIRREEQATWRRMSLCLAVSDIDADVIRRGGAKRVELCPNGVDPVDQLAFPGRSADEPLRLLFVGTVSYRPYERGIAWFVREVLPQLRERVPVELDVVGSPPLKPISAAGVRYHGRVPALQPWYERAHAVVVPVFEGSGTRLKMIEAMAYGRPVVSTPLGSEGLPVRSDEHLTAEHFIEALDELAHRRGVR